MVVFVGKRLIGAPFPVTASLVIGRTILFLLISFPVAILSALKPRSLLDRGLMLFVLIGMCCHPVWLSLILSYISVAGYCDLTYSPESAANAAARATGPTTWSCRAWPSRCCSRRSTRA